MMMFALMGKFRTPAGDESADFEAELTAHLAQQVLQVCLAGVLRDSKGQQCGIMAIIRAPTLTDAEEYLRASPYFRANRYERIDVMEYTLIAGAGQLK